VPTDKLYARATLLWMTVYAVILALTHSVIAHHSTSPWRYAIAVLPMIPLVFMARATVQHLARLDELHRRIQLNALAMTVLVTALLSLTYGFLEKVGLPHISVLWVWPWMAAIWGVTTLIAKHRYYGS
jgi:c-di-AMP phosphodiesterase-like protein